MDTFTCLFVVVAKLVLYGAIMQCAVPCYDIHNIIYSGATEFRAAVKTLAVMSSQKASRLRANVVEKVASCRELGERGGVIDSRLHG